MKILIKKILKESEGEFDWVGDMVGDVGELPFEISDNPSNKPKLVDTFVMKTTWEYGDTYLREEFVFDKKDKNEFIRFINVCKFYSVLLESRGYDRWKDVNNIAKSVGLTLGSFTDEEYGTPKDMSDFIFGSDFPAYLEGVEIFYYDSHGVEFNVILK